MLDILWMFARFIINKTMFNEAKVEIFGIKFDNLTMEEVVERLENSLFVSKQKFVVLPYSEFVVRAQKNEEFRNILNSADFCLCEGKGLYLMAKLIGKKLKQNINGIELIYNICNNFQFSISNFQSNFNNQFSKPKIFLFGGTENIVKKTAEKLGNNVVGFDHGYLEYDPVIQKINLIEPNILLVGLGSPKQEEFIYENLHKMPSIKLAIGVGGAFDFISGQVKRAPKFMQKTGTEWLWRLIIQPKRFKRIFKGVGGLICLTFKNMLCLLIRF